MDFQQPPSPVPTNQPVVSFVSEPPSKMPMLLKRWLPYSLVAIVVVGVVLLAWVLFSHAGSRANSSAETPSAAVLIGDDSFTPRTIKVKKGDAVTWTNQATSLHQIVGDQSVLSMDSQESLAQGDTYTYTFDKAGTYTYHDPLNPLKLKGTVVVQ